MFLGNSSPNLGFLWGHNMNKGSEMPLERHRDYRFSAAQGYFLPQEINQCGCQRAPGTKCTWPVMTNQNPPVRTAQHSTLSSSHHMYLLEEQKRLKEEGLRRPVLSAGWGQGRAYMKFLHPSSLFSAGFPRTSHLIIPCFSFSNFKVEKSTHYWIDQHAGYWMLTKM